MITRKELLKKLLYDPTTGEFVWLKGHRKGKIASNITKTGYVRIKINQIEYKAHNLAWLYTYGTFPYLIVDHINHNRSDNRILNLREVSHSENMKNQKKFKINKSGHTGVIFHKRDKVWQSSIGVDGTLKHLGSFKTKKEAIIAREIANIKYKYHKNHGR